MGNGSLDDIIINIKAQLDSTGLANARQKVQKELARLRDTQKKQSIVSRNAMKGIPKSYTAVSDALEKTNKRIRASMPKEITANDLLGKSIKNVTKDFSEQVGVINKAKKSLEQKNKKELASVNALRVARAKSKIDFGAGDYKKIQSAYNNMGTALKSSMSKAQAWGLAQKKVKKSMTDTANAAKRTNVQFAGWAMSLMFFGMALKRTFSTIWKSSTKTFQDVMHSTEGTVTQFDLLEGSLAYLKFGVGDALSPIVGYITPIVDKLSDLVNEFPKITAGLITAGIAFGTLFLVGGSGKLALDGFTSLAAKMGMITLKADGITKYNWGAIGSKIKNAIGVIAIGFAIKAGADTISNLKSGKDMSAAIDALKTGLFAAGGGLLMKGSGKAGGALIAIGIGLELIDQGVFITTITKTFGIITSFLNTLFEQWKVNFENGFLNGIKSSVLAFMTGAMKPLLEIVYGKDKVSEWIRETNKKTKESSFDFMAEFKDHYAHQLVTAAKQDAVINNFIAEADRASQSMMKLSKAHAEGTGLFAEGELKNILDKNILSVSQMQQLMVADRESSYLLSNYQQEWLRQQIKKEGQADGAKYNYDINTINVTSDNIDGILAQISAATSGGL